MEKFNMEFNSKKFLILLTVVCVIFFVIVIKAFEYLPDSDNSNRVMINTPSENNSGNIDTDTENKQTEKKLNITLPTKFDNVELDEVDEPKELEIIPPQTESGAAQNDNTLSKEERISKGFADARKYKNESQYINALEEYKNIIGLTNDKETVAQCYEEIAVIYGIARRYGTALSYATKAYNTHPTSYREMLLARLYYKTGDLDKATSRVNNILRRDFSDDRQ